MKHLDTPPILTARRFVLAVDCPLRALRLCEIFLIIERVADDRSRILLSELCAFARVPLVFGTQLRV
jgi:hypothetical protein